jgi:Bacterial toxin YdaS
MRKNTQKRKMLEAVQAAKRFSRPTSQRDAERDHVTKLIFSVPGFATVVARHLDVTHQNVSSWNRVPPHHVLKLAPLIRMTPQEIRPDIFGEPKGAGR